MIRAVICDVDGTLISYHTHAMPASTQNALRTLRTKHIKLIVASGRTRENMRFLDQYIAFDAVASLNGQLCYVGDRVVHRHAFDRKDIHILVDSVRREGFPCLFVGEDRLYITGMNDAVRAHFTSTKQELPPVCDASTALTHEVYQFVLYHDRQGERRVLKAMRDVQPVRAAPMCLDVLPREGGKPQGMRAILDFFGITLEETIAFGDGENDISMLQAAGIGVAMGNAEESVQAAADYVTASVDADGVQKALRHFDIL